MINIPGLDFLDDILPLMKAAKGAQGITQGALVKIGEIHEGTFLEEITILGPEYVELIRKNEDKLWEGFMDVDFLRPILEKVKLNEVSRELVLIKLIQTLLVNYDFYVTVSSLKAGPPAPSES